jgi:hypothetical protein
MLTSTSATPQATLLPYHLREDHRRARLSIAGYRRWFGDLEVNQHLSIGKGNQRHPDQEREGLELGPHRITVGSA